MKKLKVLFASLSALVVVAIPASVAAQSLVAGKVTHNGTPVAGASITAVCNTHSKSGITNVNGDYAVTYGNGECPDGITATVVASKAGMGGTNSGKMGMITQGLNIAIVNVVIPEFGIVTGAAGVAAAGGLFFVMRRRQRAAQQS